MSSAVCRVSIVLLAFILPACSRKTPSPAAPSGSTTDATRVITISGNLAFGTVVVGSSVERTFQIANSGNAPMAVSSLQATNGFTSVSAASWTSGTIAAGASQPVTIRFTPTEAKVYDATLTVVADHTSGINTAAITATGAAPTRIIGLSGSLAFGGVTVGSSAERTLQIANSGNSALTVTGIQVSGGFSSVAVASWTSGTVPAGGTQAVTIRFTPTDSRTFDGTLTVSADHTSGTNTLPFSATGVSAGPRTSFGAGTWIVNTDIAAGRYFNSPSSGCYFERLSGLGGTTGEIIGNDFIPFSAAQWIVDIASSDRAFNTDAECNTWFRDAPRRGFQSSIPPGTWLVGSQVAPGVYRATVSSGCYWERMRSFTHRGIDDVIANDFVASGSVQTIEIRPGDVGFSNDADCGTWSPVSAVAGLGVGATMVQSREERQRNRDARDAAAGRRRR